MSQPPSQDCLKLTAYFGERQRVDRRFYADVLLDLFGRHELTTSILLRGVAGYGPRHHLRTDQSLSLSEDPPVLAIGVDTRPRMEPVIAELMTVRRRGLLTVERARLLPNGPGADALLGEPRAASKLTLYLRRQQRIGRQPAFVAICDLLHRRGVAGASVFLGVDGTRHGRRQRAGFFARNGDVPTMVIAVAPGERIPAVLPELRAMLERPLATVERVQICKRDGQLLQRPYAMPAVDDHGLGLWQKLTVHTSESDRVDGQPIHRALIRRLRATARSRGATAVQGIWGFHGDGAAPHGDRFLQLGRRVPVATVVVDTPQQIQRTFDIVDELTREYGLVTSETVPGLLSVGVDEDHGGLDLARPPS